MKCSKCGSEWHTDKNCPKDTETSPDAPAELPRVTRTTAEAVAQCVAMGICPECGTTLEPGHVHRHG